MGIHKQWELKSVGTETEGGKCTENYAAELQQLQSCGSEVDQKSHLKVDNVGSPKILLAAHTQSSHEPRSSYRFG